MGWSFFVKKNAHFGIVFLLSPVYLRFEHFFSIIWYKGQKFGLYYSACERPT